MREKDGNRSVPSLDYMVDALKNPNQASRVSGESLQTCMAWRYSDGTQHLFCCPRGVTSSIRVSTNPLG
ncbi:hypothetical protein TNCV_1494231 [Trichonephila clavipes]|nr:hypothetical protein TNCV_1494231 [Trichonephila clavipes]